MAEASVDASDFLRASKALKAAGETELRKQLNKDMRSGAKPLIPKARTAARRLLPSRGGLADAVAKSPMRVQVRTGQQTAGVRVVVGNRRGVAARSANDGVVRHPVFGSDRYVDQKVTPGWFDNTMKREGPSVKPALENAIRATLDKIARDGN